ncbi:MAG: hypothetical protein PHC74_07515 [Sulfurimonas sp.]|nr:hypothetical protein [Sulfurimonas sp.]
MKVLITHQFNTKMKELTEIVQQEVVALYSFVNSNTKEDILNSSLLTKITSEDSNIFTIRGRSIRIFCTFDNTEGQDQLLFLDVTSIDDLPYQPDVKRNGETTLYDRNGEAIAYIAHNDDDTIYTYNGKPCAYIDNSNNIYGFNGQHLGWFEDNIIWEHSGQRIGFIKSTTPVLTRFEPFKGFKEFKPFKGFKQFAPFKPLKSMSNSQNSLLSFLLDGSR